MTNIIADPRYSGLAVSQGAWTAMLLRHPDDNLPITHWAFRLWIHLSAVANGKPPKESIGEHCFRSDFPDATPQELDALVNDAIAELAKAGLLKAA